MRTETDRGRGHKESDNRVGLRSGGCYETRRERGAEGSRKDEGMKLEREERSDLKMSAEWQAGRRQRGRKLDGMHRCGPAFSACQSLLPFWL